MVPWAVIFVNVLVNGFASPVQTYLSQLHAVMGKNHAVLCIQYKCVISDYYKRDHFTVSIASLDHCTAAIAAGDHCSASIDLCTVSINHYTV